jgi:outer membrane protein assembly factor BamB
MSDRLVPLVCWLAVALALAAVDASRADPWPQWRGPHGDGVSRETAVPLTWDEHSHIVWKCPLPGQGASTPVVWGEAVFVTTQEENRLLLLKINRETGRVAWSREVGTGAPERMPLRGKRGDERRRQKFHSLHNMASPSPVTDGERVIVHFGNGDLAAYDFAGQQLWKHNLQQEFGPYTIWWGHANSPILVNDLVISACMQDALDDLPGERSPSYLVAHDKRSGRQVWQAPRAPRAQGEQYDAYTTPILRPTPRGPQLVIMGGNQLDAYDPATGRQLWFHPGLVGGRTITGPTVGSDLIFATQGMRGSLLAIRPEGEGQLPPSAVVWKQTQGTPDSSTPVVSNGLLFWVSDNGIAHCCDARTGQVKWKERLPGDYKASLVAAAGRIYFLNLGGLCTVVAAAPRFEKLGENQLERETIASPAIADGHIYIRSRIALYCIGPK